MNPAGGAVALSVLLGLATAALGAAALGIDRGQLTRRAAGRVGGPVHVSGPPARFASVLSWLAPGADGQRAFTVAVLVASVAVGGLALVAPLVVGAVVSVAGAAALLIRHRGPRPVSTADYEVGLLTCLAELRSSLASGASLRQAVAEAARHDGPVPADLAAVDRGVLGGRALQGELDRWAARRADAGVPLVADALAIAGSSGASQALAVDAVVATLRTRRARALEVRALASQARASAVVLVATPLAFATTVSILDPRVGRFLATTPPGWACVLGGLSLDAAGAWWMATLVRRVR